jgi:glutathione S-transferase
MAKNIVFCADGTWNHPNQDENEDHLPDPTNVYKLFSCLNGAPSIDTIRNADEQEKELVEDGQTSQITKYIHGVGDSRNAIHRIIGGAFGTGVIARIVRGYTFISRNYEPGAKIFIIGFSRGAYTARALAGVIASQGLLRKDLTKDKELSYRYGAQAWYRYRDARKTKKSFLARLAEILADLPAFISHGSLKDDDLTPVNSIAAVGVWDTVGALGFPKYDDEDKRIDAFRFANTKLSVKVKKGFHAVSIDEQRASFTPTFWDRSPRITQTLFPGAHADVGGGYPGVNEESGLSDAALRWMMEKLYGAGVLFADPVPIDIKPNAAGKAHMPWINPPWTKMSIVNRKFPKGLEIHPSVEKRKKSGKVFPDPSKPSAKYNPVNLLPSGD